MDTPSLLADFVRWFFVNVMVALGLALLAYHPAVTRRLKGRWGPFWRDVTVTSVMGFFCMSFPWVVGVGQQMDIRMVPLGLAGWRQGWLASLVVGVVLVFLRFLKGGPGAWTSLYYTMVCVALVIPFARRPRTLGNLALMGLLQTLGGYTVGQLMVQPPPPGLHPTSIFWPLMAVIQAVSFWLVNGAIEMESENERLQNTLSDALRSKEAVLELIPYGVLFLNEQGAVQDSNREARTLLSGTLYAALVLQHPDVRDALTERTRLAGCRISVPGPADTERILLVSALPLVGGGTVLGLENVTKVIRQEREEARRNRLELLGRMASMAAHEIKNPLTTIKGFLQLFTHRPEFAGHKATFALVQGEVEHINRVVSDFLELSGNSAPRLDEVSLDDLLHEVVLGTELQQSATGVRVEWSGEQGMAVLADPRSLKQILRNLVVNAYEAMPTGGLLVLGRWSTAKGVRIDIGDSGPGVAAEVLANIFTPYMTTKTTGTGLGLAISHKLATDMGGELTVKSEAGKGSIFSLFLPRHGVAAKAAASNMSEGD